MTDFATSLAAAKKATGPKGEPKSSTVPELSGHGSGLPGWSHFMPEERELSDMWRGPTRIETVDSMLNHYQVAAIRQAVRLPAHRYIIELDPGELDPVASDLLGADLDVPLLGAEDEQRPGRRADRFSARRHLDRAMDALDYGHAVFEHTGRIDDAGYWRLADLPPIPQWTICDDNSWEIDRHGRLIRVVQWGSNPPVKIPVEHLVTFTWQGRPGDPRGRSLLRPLTGAWTMSDRTMRVMGMSAERTGMGIPVGKVPQGAVAGAKQKMEALLAGLAAGHDTNLVLETDGDIRQEVMLMGVTGQTPDLVGMLKYYDEVMARATLAMLLQLGQTEMGSRALGVTFDDLLAMFHDAVIDWYCDTMTQQLVERWVDRNRGEDHLTDGVMPRLVWSRREDDEDGEDNPAPEPLTDREPEPVAARRKGREHGTAAGARRALRGRQAVGSVSVAKDVPAGEGIASEPGSDASRANGSSHATHAPSPAARATRAAFATVAGRDLRRDPSEHELAAATDFATIEANYVATRESVTNALLAIREELAAHAVEEVAAMEQVDPLTLGDTLATLLEDEAQDMDSAPLIALLVAFAVAGVHQVISEAARQGVALDADVDYRERAEADAADLMRRMARQVAESAAAAARTSLPAGESGQPAANVIAEHLQSLTAAAAEQAAAGATSRAQNAGRAAAIEAGPVVALAASELLDPATCGPCLLNDGHMYDSLDEALADYPSAGYRRCEGMERCRGMIVAIFAVEPALA